MMEEVGHVVMCRYDNPSEQARPVYLKEELHQQELFAILVTPNLTSTP